jgi:hypothetical protein
MDVARIVANEEWSDDSRKSHLLAWRLALEDGSEPAFVGVLLMLMPNLEQLYLLPALNVDWSPSIVSLFGLDPETMDSPMSPFNVGDCTWGRTPRLKKLKFVKFRSNYTPKALNFLHTLRSTDLSFGAGHNCEISQQYCFITPLRIGTTLESIRGRHVSGVLNLNFCDIVTVLGWFPFLKIFDLYDNSTATKNIDQLYVGTNPPFCFDNIPGALSEHNPQLRALTLPDNWFRSAITDRGLINDMSSFKCLKALSVPECAIKSLSSSVVHGTVDDNILPLPLEQISSTLQSLRIVDPSVSGTEANLESLLTWLHTLLFGAEDYSMFRGLRFMRIVVGVSRKQACQRLVKYVRYGNVL